MTQTKEFDEREAAMPCSERSGGCGDKLTRLEQQVLTMLLQGSTSAGVADKLGITRRSVEIHVCGIYDKLGARTRLQAIGEAARRGLFPPV
jgi:two-component system nitrate/nitrite response regulator NarL